MWDNEEKQEQSRALKRRYDRLGKRGKQLLKKAERDIYSDDILQPFQPRFKARWYQAWKDRNLIHDAVDRAELRRQQEREESYRKKPSRGVVTLEERILKDVQKEHPTMLSDDDVAKHRDN